MDIGVFASSFWIRNQHLSPETRGQIGRLAGLLDMGPRSSLILMLATGLILTASGGWGLQQLGAATPFVVATVAALCLVWLWAVWQQHFALAALSSGQPLGRRTFFVRQFRTFDLYLRVAIAIA